MLATRADDVDVESCEVRIATLKRRREHWRCVPVPEALIHDLELVHRLRRTQRSPRGRLTRLWPVSRATATRHVTELMAAAGIEGPQASAKGLRHAYGVAAVAAGGPLPTVAAVLGHASSSPACGADPCRTGSVGFRPLPERSPSWRASWCCRGRARART